MKSNLAFIMLKLGNICPGSNILDPFCGSGTFLIEANDAFDGDITGTGIDNKEAAARGANHNSALVGAADRIKFIKGSAMGLSKMFSEGEFDAVVTNPPWGVVTGVNADLEQLYRKCLSGAWKVLKPGGRVVMLVLHALMFLELARSFGQYRIVIVRSIKTRNNIPTIFVLERLAADPIYTDLKGQLHRIGDFVQMNSTVFNAIHSAPQSRGRRNIDTVQD